MVWNKDDEHAAARVVTRAMVEGVRAALFHAEADRVIAAAGLPRTSVVTFSRPPELLDVPELRQDRTGPVVLLHPDPELSVHERDVLRAAHSRMQLVTPTTAFAGVLGRSLTALGIQGPIAKGRSPNVT